MEGKWVTLTKGVQQALTDFRWLAEDLGSRSTRLYELFLLHPTLHGYENASRYMCVWALLLGPMEVPRTLQLHTISATTSPEPAISHLIVLWAHFPVNITAQLVY